MTPLRAVGALALALLLAAVPARLYAQSAPGLATEDTGVRELSRIGSLRTQLMQTNRSAEPLQWSAAQAALAAALAARGERLGDTALLQEAADAYGQALQERTRARAPGEWAMMMVQLGRVLRLRGDRLGGVEGRSAQAAAVASLQGALEEMPRGRLPLVWAATQAELGLALMGLAEAGSGTEPLEAAVAAHRLALDARTGERARREQATSQMQLGLALAALGERTSSPALLAEALENFEPGLAFLAPIWSHSERMRARVQRDRIRRELQRQGPP